MIMASIIAVLNKRKNELFSLVFGVLIGYILMLTSMQIPQLFGNEIKIPMEPFPEPAW